MFAATQVKKEFRELPGVHWRCSTATITYTMLCNVDFCENKKRKRTVERKK